MSSVKLDQVVSLGWTCFTACPWDVSGRMNALGCLFEAVALATVDASHQS